MTNFWTIRSGGIEAEQKSNLFDCHVLAEIYKIHAPLRIPAVNIYAKRMFASTICISMTTLVLTELARNVSVGSLSSTLAFSCYVPEVHVLQISYDCSSALRMFFPETINLHV